MASSSVEQVDVLVVGTGCAGCAAALGALLYLPDTSKVVLLEKSPKLKGGTTKLAMGAWVWFPRNGFLKSMGLDDPEDSVVALLEHMSTKASVSGSKPPDVRQRELMRAFARESPLVLEELQSRNLFPLKPPPLSAKNSAVGDAEEMATMKAFIQKRAASVASRGVSTGLRADDDATIERLAGCLMDYSADEDLSAIPSGRTLAPDGGTTSGLLLKAVGSFKNAEIRMGHEVVEFIREGARVVGLRVRTSEGVKDILASKGVIFGSGGYSQNKEIMEAQHGRGVVSGTCSSRTNTGDLVRICQEQAIPVAHLELAWWKQTVLPFNPNRMVSGGVFFLNGDSFIVVDATGKRYADEKEFYQQRGLAMLDTVGGAVDRRYVFFVLDDRSLERFAGPLKGLGGPIPMGEDECLLSAKGPEPEKELAGLIQQRLDELSGKSFSLRPDFAEGLKHQISRFNDFARSGVDTEFQRGTRANTLGWHVGRQRDNSFPNKTMFPIEYGDGQALHAILLGLATLDTKGGPVVDASSRILDRHEQPVPGLYGAGNCVSSYSERAYPAAGSTVSNGITFGFIAGRHAAQHGVAASPGAAVSAPASSKL